MSLSKFSKGDKYGTEDKGTIMESEDEGNFQINVKLIDERQGQGDGSGCNRSVIVNQPRVCQASCAGGWDHKKSFAWKQQILETDLPSHINVRDSSPPIGIMFALEESSLDIAKSSPVSCGESTPPISCGESTPPMSCGETAPFMSCGELAPPIFCGKSTPPISFGKSTTPESRGKSTPSVSCGESTPPISCGKYTPLMSCGNSTPPMSCVKLTPSVSCGKLTPSVSCGKLTPSVSCGETTPPISCGKSTNPTSSEESALPMSCGKSTPPISCGKSTPSVSCGKSTPSVSCGKSTPPISCGKSTPFVSCGKSTPLMSGEESLIFTSSGEPTPTMPSKGLTPIMSSGESLFPMSSGESTPPMSSMESTSPMSSGESAPSMSSGESTPSTSYGNLPRPTPTWEFSALHVGESFPPLKNNDPGSTPPTPVWNLPSPFTMEEFPTFIPKGFFSKKLHPLPLLPVGEFPPLPSTTGKYSQNRLAHFPTTERFPAPYKRPFMQRFPQKKSFSSAKEKNPYNYNRFTKPWKGLQERLSTSSSLGAEYTDDEFPISNPEACESFKMVLLDLSKDVKSSCVTSEDGEKCFELSASTATAFTRARETKSTTPWCYIRHFEKTKIKPTVHFPYELPIVKIDARNDDPNLKRPKKYYGKKTPKPDNTMRQISLGQFKALQDKSVKSYNYHLEIQLDRKTQVYVGVHGPFSVFVERQCYAPGENYGNRPEGVLEVKQGPEDTLIFDVDLCLELLQTHAGAAEYFALSGCPPDPDMIGVPLSREDIPLRKMTQEESEKFIEYLLPLCTFRISFGVGWGRNFEFQRIEETPCWIQVNLREGMYAIKQLLDMARKTRERPLQLEPTYLPISFEFPFLSTSGEKIEDDDSLVEESNEVASVEVEESTSNGRNSLRLMTMKLRMDAGEVSSHLEGNNKIFQNPWTVFDNPGMQAQPPFCMNNEPGPFPTMPMQMPSKTSWCTQTIYFKRNFYDENAPFIPVTPSFKGPSGQQIIIITESKSYNIYTGQFIGRQENVHAAGQFMNYALVDEIGQMPIRNEHLTGGLEVLVDMVGDVYVRSLLNGRSLFVRSEYMKNGVNLGHRESLNVFKLSTFRKQVELELSLRDGEQNFEELLGFCTFQLAINKLSGANYGLMHFERTPSFIEVNLHHPKLLEMLDELNEARFGDINLFNLVK